MSDPNQARLAKITENVVDNGQFISHQVSYLGKEANGIAFYPYGFHANAPVESWALMLSIQGHPDNRALLVSEPKVRPELLSGEVALYSPLIPDLIIKLQIDDKLLLIKSPMKVLVEAPEIELKGNVTVTGNLTVNFTDSMTMTDGNLTVDGSTTLSATVTSSGKDISNTHTHEGSPTVPALNGISDTGAVN